MSAKKSTETDEGQKRRPKKIKPEPAEWLDIEHGEEVQQPKREDKAATRKK